MLFFCPLVWIGRGGEGRESGVVWCGVVGSALEGMEGRGGRGGGECVRVVYMVKCLSISC